MNGSAPADDRKSGEFGHVPVLLHRVTDLLRPGIEALGDDAVVVDGTLGAGGHTEYLLEHCEGQKNVSRASVIAL